MIYIQSALVSNLRCSSQSSIFQPSTASRSYRYGDFQGIQFCPQWCSIENVFLIVFPYVHQNVRKLCSCKRSFEQYQDRTKERLRGCSGEPSFKWSFKRYKKPIDVLRNEQKIACSIRCCLLLMSCACAFVTAT